MPWHCPACNSIIRHSEVDPKPHVGERYRCHVCRLSLEFDGGADKLTIAPLEADHHVKALPARARAIPSPVVKSKRKGKVERRKAQRRRGDRRKVAKRKKATRKPAKRKSGSRTDPVRIFSIHSAALANTRYPISRKHPSRNIPSKELIYSPLTRFSIFLVSQNSYGPMLE